MELVLPAYREGTLSLLVKALRTMKLIGRQSVVHRPPFADDRTQRTYLSRGFYFTGGVGEIEIELITIPFVRRSSF